MVFPPHSTLGSTAAVAAAVLLASAAVGGAAALLAATTVASPFRASCFAAAGREAWQLRADTVQMQVYLTPVLDRFGSSKRKERVRRQR